MRSHLSVSCSVLLVCALGPVACVDPGDGDGENEAAVVFSSEDEVGEAAAALDLSLCNNGVQGDGELCFDSPVQVTTAHVSALAVGALDANRKLDLVAATASTDQIHIRIGDGDGGFPTGYLYSMNDSPGSVAIGDFNDDGHRDILAGAFNADQARIRWGGDSPSWSVYSDYASGSGPRRVRVGDLNGDGYDDFIALGSSDALTVRIRNPGGGFAAAATYATGASSADVQLADCDGDGDLDLLYVDGFASSAALKVRKNDGAGAFGASTSTNLGLGAGELGQTLTVGDWNEDAARDAIVVLSSNKMVRLLGTGACTFAGVVSASTEPNPGAITNADMDRDGHLDLVIAHKTSEKVSIYLGLGNGSFSAPAVYFLGLDVLDVKTGDFNEDDTPDVLYGTPSGAYLMTSAP